MLKISLHSIAVCVSCHKCAQGLNAQHYCVCGKGWGVRGGVGDVGNRAALGALRQHLTSTGFLHRSGNRLCVLQIINWQTSSTQLLLMPKHRLLTLPSLTSPLLVPLLTAFHSTPDPLADPHLQRRLPPTAPALSLPAHQTTPLPYPHARSTP